MEIITGVERRRRWRDEEKLRILAELEEPGVRFNDVARRYDVSRGLLWQWRDAQRRGRLVAEASGFVPLRIVPELPAPEPQGLVAATSMTLGARRTAASRSCCPTAPRFGLPRGSALPRCGA